MDVTEPYGWCKKHMRVVQYNDKCDDFEPAFKRVCGNCEHFYHEDGVCPYKPHEVYPDDEACERFKPAKELCICINCAHSEWPCGSQPDGGSPDVKVGSEPTEYVVPLRDERIAETFKHLYKLLEHVKHVLGEVEARLRELESELRTSGVLMPDGGLPEDTHLCAGGRQRLPSWLNGHFYLVIYDMPSKLVPSWAVRDTLKKLAKDGVDFVRLQQSVLATPRYDDAVKLAEELYLTASKRRAGDEALIMVCEATRFSWGAITQRALELRLAEKLRAERASSPAHTCVPLDSVMSPKEAWTKMDKEERK